MYTKAQAGVGFFGNVFKLSYGTLKRQVRKCLNMTRSFLYEVFVEQAEERYILAKLSTMCEVMNLLTVIATQPTSHKNKPVAFLEIWQKGGNTL